VQEKEAQQRALAQQKSTIASKPQVSKPPHSNPHAKANNPSPNPGLGVTNQTQQARQAQQPQQPPQLQPSQLPQQAPEAAVTGKIYRSKWSQRHG